MMKLFHRAAIAVAVASILSSGLALGQEEQKDKKKEEGKAETFEEITVTGSILRRTDVETPSPVTTMSSKLLDERGINTVAEALQRLPANGAGTIQQGWNTGFNFASGAVAPSLRGLTVQDTLSIVDGLRLAPYPLADDGQRNFVDLNSIPSGVIDRIEVLRDGASSTYGADAIAGVVNVITKKEIQGIHFGGSTGISERGDGQEHRLDFTWGHGRLSGDGYNFYLGGEWQKDNAVWARDRDYPFNTMDYTRICGPTGSCMHNNNWNGVTAEDGLFNGLFSIPGVTLVRSVASGANTGSGRFQYLNTAAGCRQWPQITITAAQSATSPLNPCEINFQSAYQMIQPEVERYGVTMRFTTNVGDRAQFYTMANFYTVNTFASFTPIGFNGLPTPPRPAGLAAYNVLLPVYVCKQGVGTPSGENTGCDQTNGQLNPYNPFAANGQRAQALLRSPYGRTVRTNARTLRFITGLEGTFLDDWRYAVNLAASEVGLTVLQSNYLIPQRIMDVVARGTFNFSDPYATPRDVWNYIAPNNTTYSPSRLWQAQGTLSKGLLMLPGGSLQAAVGAAYRYESITNPSANPANDSAPYTRYYSINAVGAEGNRNVKSTFFEVDAPVLRQVELIGSGRFDKYSTGQSNFSPKLGIKVTPISQLALRGTWSKGFRIPSFNEAFGLPTTGYVNRTVDCTQFASYCAAHGNNAYATQPYSVGLTQTGNPNLNPEKSESFTTGLVVEPIKNLGLTLDYWHIKVKGLISGITDTSAAEAQYYNNNGNVNIPGVTVLPGTPDPANPNALPQIGFIQTSYSNQDSEVVSGIDFGVNYRISFAPGWTYRTSLDTSYLQKYEVQTAAGATLRYDDTLSPCNITSCSGSPKWRGVFQNTVEYRDTSATLTAYYTGGYDTASIDFGGKKGDCAGNAAIGASTASYVDGTPVNCRTGAQWNVDLTARQKLFKNYTLALDVLNIFNIKPKFDPSAAYGLYGYNPAWAGPNIMGRYFRLGVKVDF